MIRFLPVLVALFFSVTCQSAVGPSVKDPGNFSGRWHWSKADEDLTLNLVQEGTALSGTHEAIGEHGDRVDEVDLAGPPSISGTISGDSAVVEFKSGFPDSDGGGVAKLTLRRGKLVWHVTESSGEHYLPLDAVLDRVVP